MEWDWYCEMHIEHVYESPEGETFSRRYVSYSTGIEEADMTSKVIFLVQLEQALGKR